MTATSMALVTAAMRAGYAARGFVYGFVGVIALSSAIGDNETSGLVGSLSRLEGAAWNAPVLLAIAAGLVGYSIWRGLDSIIDLAGHGRGFGWVERFGLFFVSALHLAFAWYAARLAFGGAAFVSGSRSQAARAVAGMIENPLGRWFVVLVGVGTISFGCYSIWKGAFARFHNHMRQAWTLDRIAPLLSFGLVSRGVVLGIMGGLIVWAGWALEPDAAGGYGHTLTEIRKGWHGRTMLGVAGGGMVAFAFYCFAETIYRVIPSRPCAEQDAGDEHPRRHLA